MSKDELTDVLYLYEKTVALMQQNEEFIYGASYIDDDNDENDENEHDLNTEYDYLLQIYDGLKEGHVDDKLNYMGILANFLYLYAKSIGSVTL